MNVIKIDKKDIKISQINEVAKVVKEGGTIIFPTKHIYGLGADAYNINAVKKIYEIKKRDEKKAMPILIKNREALNDLVSDISDLAKSFMDKFWHGNLTIVLKAKESVPKILTLDKKIGLRIPQHPFAYLLVNDLKNPLIGTSANLKGNEPANKIEDIDTKILESVDLIVDIGELEAGDVSTVIDLSQGAPVILRESKISSDEINASYQSFVDKY